MVIELNGVEQTNRFAECLSRFIKPGMTLCLSGDLGAGKTTFTKALAKAAGVTEHVTSPSFTLVNEYHSGHYPFYHMDVYRIDAVTELDEIGFDEYFADHAVVVVEWGERVAELLPQNRINIGLYRGEGEDQRRLEIGETEVLEKRLKQWLHLNWKG